MKTTLKLSILALAAAFGLASCQKTADPAPQTPAASHAPDAAAKANKTYTLTKHGKAALTYLPDGRLQKVEYTNSWISRTDYTYGFLSVKATSYEGGANPKVSHEETMLTDVNTGLCYESQYVGYTYYSFGTVVTEKKYKYEYDAQKRLKKRYNKAKPTERDEYSWNNNGDLYEINSYSANGAHTQKTGFSYLKENEPYLLDRYPLNQPWANVPDEYLRMFGKTSKHLVRRVAAVENGVLTVDRRFNYVLNADGYVKEKSEYLASNGNLLQASPYEYKVDIIW